MVLLLVDQKSHKQFVYCKFVLTTCPLARKQVFIHPPGTDCAAREGRSRLVPY